MSSFALRSTAIRGYLTRTLRRPGPVVGPRPAAVAAGSGDKKKLVFLGTPEVAASALEAILDAAEAPDAAFEAHAVVSQPGRPRGRGRSKSGPPPPSPVAEAAMRRGIPEDMVLCPVKANEPDFLQRLRDMEPDLMITAAYGNFLPQKFLDIPRLGTLNIHPSLLPQFRGAAPVISSPLLSRRAGFTPKNGKVAEPGFKSVTPGNGVIIMDPVSVCHQVSTIGQRPSPMTLKYHSHASGFIGSPTDPRIRRELRDVALTGSSPTAIRARIAVGAV